MKAFTLIHVAISLAGILSGFVVLLGLLTAKRLDSWTALFLATTAATSVTGFFFPFHGVTPAIVVGVISLVVLTVAALAITQLSVLMLFIALGTVAVFGFRSEQVGPCDPLNHVQAIHPSYARLRFHQP